MKVVSGLADEYSLDDIRDAIHLILPKPFSKSEMVDAVESALSGIDASATVVSS